MIISDIKINALPEGLELSGNVQSDTANNGDFRVWFRFSPNITNLSLSGDPFLALFLIPCMYAGENLHLSAPISHKLFNRVLEIQTLLKSWYSDLSEIQVTAEEVVKETVASISPYKGCFFSGGVDSWYSLLKHQTEITHLICIRGVEMRTFNDEVAWLQQKQSIETIANTLNKELIIVTSNFRKQTDMNFMKPSNYHAWGKFYPGDFYAEYYHGAALASVGLSLQPLLSEIMIPSSYPYIVLEKWGSHPLLDHLFSTENVTFTHDGAESTRFEKIERQIKNFPLALQTLNVCYENNLNQTNDSYNCCECFKCLRTMIHLRLNNVLDQATAFPKPINMEKVQLLKIHPDLRYDFIHTFNLSKEVGDQEMATTLAIALDKTFNYQRWVNVKLKPFVSKVKSKLLPKTSKR